MAQVKIEEIVDHLSSEMKRALEETVNEHFPGASYNRDNLYRTFKQNVYRKCNIWEQVPNQYVKG